MTCVVPEKLTTTRLVVRHCCAGPRGSIHILVFYVHYMYIHNVGQPETRYLGAAAQWGLEIVSEKKVARAKHNDFMSYTHSCTPPSHVCVRCFESRCEKKHIYTSRILRRWRRPSDREIITTIMITWILHAVVGTPECDCAPPPVSVSMPRKV